MSAAAVERTAHRDDAYWWQGALMSIKARAADTGGALGLVEARFPEGFGPPLHVHEREDEAFYVLEGKIRFRQGEEEFVAAPGTLVCGDHAGFHILSKCSRAVLGHL